MWTQEELDEIDRRLNLGLGPEYIAHRAGGRGSVAYVEGWKVINLANQVFGFDGWSSEIKELKVDYADDVEGKISMGVSATIKVTLKNGVTREDCGYGSIDNCRNKSLAYDKCRKEACTDALKRCLRLFGPLLGNCLYDMRFISKVSKVKPKFKPFNEDDLLRPDLEFSSIRKKSSGRSPAKLVKATKESDVRAKESDSRAKETEIRAKGVEAQTREPEIRTKEPEISASRNTSSTNTFILNDNEIPMVDGIPFLNSQDFETDTDHEEIDGLLRVEDISESQGAMIEVANQNNESSTAKQQNGNTSLSTITNSNSNGSILSSNGPISSTNIPISGFVSARAAEIVQEKRSISTTDAFDPNFQSPQLKRTLDHNMSVPIKRNTQETPTPNRFGKSFDISNRTPIQSKNTANIQIVEKRAKSVI